MQGANSYTKTRSFISVALICILILAIAYLLLSVFAVCAMGYGHLGQSIPGYFLTGMGYYKPLPKPEDDIDDEQELELANEEMVA